MATERGQQYAGDARKVPKAALKVYMQAKHNAGEKESISHPPVMAHVQKHSVATAVSLARAAAPPASQSKPMPPSRSPSPLAKVGVSSLPKKNRQKIVVSPSGYSTVARQPTLHKGDAPAIPGPPSDKFSPILVMAAIPVPPSGTFSPIPVMPSMVDNVAPMAPPTISPKGAGPDTSMLASSSSSLKRVVSKRFKEGTTTPLNAKELLNLVKQKMKNLPKHMQVPHLKDKTVAQLDQILDDEIHLRSVASLAAQCDAARLKLTQPVHRDVNIRILALLATDPQLLDLYKLSLCATTQQMLDAGSDPNTNSGMGMGLNHKYHQELELKFNDIAICPDFPFEYYESDSGPGVHSDGTILTCPAKIRGGLFAAFSLLQARKPEGFPNAFFTIEMLDKIFVAGKQEYHNMISRWDVSGQHGGKPMWFFVAPVRTIIPEEQHHYLEMPVKRWDTLAFHKLFENIEDLKLVMTKTVPGGVGGMNATPTPPPSASAGSCPRQVLANARAAANKVQQEALAMQRELHELQVAELRRKSVAAAAGTTTHLLQRILETTKLLAQFEVAGCPDMVKQCEQELAAMKAQLAPIIPVPEQ